MQVIARCFPNMQDTEKALSGRKKYCLAWVPVRNNPLVRQKQDENSLKQAECAWKIAKFVPEILFWVQKAVRKGENKKLILALMKVEMSKQEGGRPKMKAKSMMDDSSTSRIRPLKFENANETQDNPEENLEHPTLNCWRSTYNHGFLYSKQKYWYRN